MERYVAFFRGISHAGSRRFTLRQLRKVFEGIGCVNIKMILSSGTVIFTPPYPTPRMIHTKLCCELQKRYAYSGSVSLRPLRTLETLYKMDPFAHLPRSLKRRQYITFIEEIFPRKKPQPSQEITVINTTDREVFSVLTRTSGHRTQDAHKALDEVYGKKVATRNWNTLRRIISSG